MVHTNYLFTKPGILDLSERIQSTMFKEIDTIDSSKILDSETNDLCDYFEKKYRLDVPVLDESNISTDSQEVQIDVSHSPYRFNPHGGPIYVKGTKISFYVPFEGNPDFFQLQASTYTSCPPIGEFSDSELIITFQSENPDPEKIKSGFQKQLSEIKEHLEWLRNDVKRHNESIRNTARVRFESRKQKLIDSRNAIDSLGFPKRKKNDPSQSTSPHLIQESPKKNEWDIFISHASEDKADFVRPLAEALIDKGLKVWFDETTLKIGDSLRRSIDRGLAKSRYGVVVLSNHFLRKDWPQKELDGLTSLEIDGRKVILPIWHNISKEEVMAYSPILADRLAANSSYGLDKVVKDISAAIGK